MTSFSRIVMASVTGLAISACGCSPNSAPSAPTGSNSKGGATRSQAESDLGFLHFAFTEPVFGKTPERLPPDLSAAATSINLVDWRIYERVKSGEYVVHWGAAMNEPVLAYEKQAPTQGGWVLRGTGRVENMSAEQLQALLAQKAG